MKTSSGLRWTVLLCAAVLALTACGDSEAGTGASERDHRPGLTLTGTVAGRQVAVRDGAPELVLGDCDPRDSSDDDVCAISQSIGGELFVLVFENPDVLTSGETVPVEGSSCRATACDAITDHAVVDVQFGSDRRIRATGGELRLSTVQPLVYYSGELRLEVGGGRLSGEFDVLPRDE